MKRILMICCIVVLSLFSVGCAKVIKLTDDENYLIAEYAAELMLKYDRNFNLKYYDESTEFITTELSTEEIATTEEELATDTDAKPQGGSSSQQDDSTLTSVDNSFDIGKFLGLAGVSITYKQVLVTDTYPSQNHDGMYIEITAPDGYKLLVLKFDMKNTTSIDSEIDLYNMGVEYSIVVNDEKKAKQMFTILVDDMYTYQGVVMAGSSQEVVLIFQVSDNVVGDIKGLDLIIDKGSEKKVLSIQ